MVKALGSLAQAAPSDLPPHLQAMLTPAARAAALARVPAYVPAYLVPDAVLLAWHLWQGAPVVYFHDHRGGWGWEAPQAFKEKSRSRFQLITSLPLASPALSRWLAEHPAGEITARNLLNPVP